MQAGAALAETERLVSTTLHLPHHEYPEGQQQNERNSVDQDVHPAAAAFLVVFDVDLLPHVIQGLVIGRDHRVQLLVVILVCPLEIVTSNSDTLDLAGSHFVHQLGVGELRYLLRLVVVDHGPEQHHHHNDDHPEDGGLDIRVIHSFSLHGSGGSRTTLLDVTSCSSDCRFPRKLPLEGRLAWMGWPRIQRLHRTAGSIQWSHYK